MFPLACASLCEGLENDVFLFTGLSTAYFTLYMLYLPAPRQCKELGVRLERPVAGRGISLRTYNLFTPIFTLTITPL